MKTPPTTLLPILILLIQSCDTESITKQIDAPNYCATDESWSNCDGKMVKIIGSNPPLSEIMQHPMLDSPQLLPPGNEAKPVKHTKQSYLNINNRQIIVLSDTTIDCPNNIELVGTLERISLGGPAETKLSYKGWSIRVNQHRCLE